MNKEISEFWKSLGYNIIEFKIRNYIYFIVSKTEYVETLDKKVALIPGDNDIEYFLLNSPAEYSEKEMLQLIKLRAFL